jgi:hypothetical protein
MTDDVKHIRVTSHHQSGGITAGIVNIGSEPEARSDVLCVNAKDGDRYACQVRLAIVGADAATAFQVEAVDKAPIDLELLAENAAMVFQGTPPNFVQTPEHKAVEMRPPLAPSYVATIRADQPIAKADLKWRFV